MRIYYRGPDARVTDQHFIRRTSSAEVVFSVRELRNVVRVQGGPAVERMGGIIVTGAGLVTLTAASWSLVGPTAGYAMAVVAILIALAVVTVTRRNARQWHVRATYRGVDVTLYSSSDRQMFNQVARALVRAIEDSRPVRETRGLAAA
ncbi:hypothetical protein Asp14428_42700 [Actinoplanes sp. NBRC 14428]|nr:hypothetical protein Asp14428_42700 [Actinoplanes sp. NBRC 14428]